MRSWRWGERLVLCLRLPCLRSRFVTVASAFYGPFTGVATGMQTRDTNTDDMEAGTSHDAVHNRSTYQGRFTYSFRVDGFGNVSGTGHGVFTSAPDWDVSGVTGGTQALSDRPHPPRPL